MGGKMDERMDGEWSSRTDEALTFLYEECVPVRSLWQTDERTGGRAVVTPDCFTPPIGGLIENGGGGSGSFLS